MVRALTSLGQGSTVVSKFVLEAKYWAGLTEAQPVSYLEELPEAGGVLLFVAPARRLDTLWTELCRRCQDAGYLGKESGEQRHLRFDNRILALTSWHTLLNVIGSALDQAGDFGLTADVRQLRGLCDKMDSDAFLPLRSEELTSDFGRRAIQFGELVKTLADVLVARGHANGKGLRASGGNGWFGRYLRLKGYGCLLYYSSWRWANWGSSPIWLWIKGPDWKPSPAVRDALAIAGIEFRLGKDACYVPILLPTGIERDGVVKHALTQLDRIVAALPAVVEGGVAAVEPPPEAESAEDNVDVSQ